ncbi:MAG: MGMT family protein, partial [Candidatus Omnitrophica bacterium]|nr:MGMT family protein [Candidatus Omnitrophota bacterium]
KYQASLFYHRVVKSDGTLGKYAGKDDGRKERLLRAEQEIIEKIKAF